MTENKRFEVVMNEFDEVEYIMDKVMMEDRDFAEFIDFVEGVCKENEQLKQENKELKLQNEELLYQIGRVGKNNKPCRGCECFIPEFKYCYMWDMEVEADEVVVACNKRNVS